MTPGEDVDDLLVRARGGDAAAGQELLARHRARLCRMVAVRLDPRLAARCDPSDVVQEALLEASRKLPDYLRDQPVAFYPWLRRLAWEHLLKVRQRHLAGKRNAALEAHAPPLADGSAAELAERFLASGTSPSAGAAREEERQRVRTALLTLAEADREVLVLRYLEQLSTGEIGAVLGIGASAVKMRHRRALERLARVLETRPSENACERVPDNR
jgi:RNA polymerase sigma-70 factor (ECF subfamily)